MSIEKDNNRVAEAITLLTDLFRNRPRVVGFLKSFVEQNQLFENAAWGMLESRMLDTPPVGDQLDQIGKMVGENREGRSDAEYYEATLLRIRVNRSEGRAIDVMQIVDLSVSPTVWEYEEYYPAAFVVKVLNISTAKIKALASAIRETRAIGVKGMLHTSNWPEAENFVWGYSSPGQVPNQRGYAYSVPATFVSKFIAALKS